MPILNPSIPTLQSGPSNAWGLVQFLQQRVPGYDPSEYLREINSAYIHVWEEITKLRNNWFTNVAVVTTTKAQFIYDFRYNADSALNAAVSPRLYQIVRIRVLPNSTTGNLYQTSRAMTLQSPDFIAISSNPSATPTQTGPYYWVVQGKNSVQFGLPLAIGTQLEVTYTYWPLGLTYISAGNVTSTGTAVTGTNTFFTQLLPPDFQSLLPSGTGTSQELAEAELICNSNQVYRVATVTSDTALSTVTAISPTLGANSTYVLASVPEVPREHLRVVASVALPKIYGWVGDDARISEATTIAEKNVQMMKDSLIERQAQDPPRRTRFPYGIARRNRAFLR